MVNATGMLGFGFWSEAMAADPVTVLVTGANRGIGLEFARQYAARGYKVIATARDPAKADALKAAAGVIVERLDVNDHASVDALAAKLKGTAIDILVNNAGIGGGGDNQVFGRIKYPVFDDVMHTNVVGPLKIAEAFVEHVAASAKKMLMMVSSSQGSIASARGASLYFYRSSKTALNMITINLAKTLKERGIIVGLVAPGATDTDFMAEVRGRMPLGDPKERTADMIAEIDKFTMEKSGAFVEWNGQTIPW
ncbi:MAG: SDR family oxidoreductase [Alphaproteobacteria bacterium]|nr:SDR family oxidoreductase [Alphaproteobacteria bacterium]